MANLGVFRDEFYNAAAALTESQFAATVANLSGALIPASAIAGARQCYFDESAQTTAQTATTDTAVNIIAQLQNAVAAAQKANVGGFAASLGATPPLGVPNLFNVTWNFTIVNQNASAGTLTLTAGSGVTLATAGAASATVVTFATVAVYSCQVTGPTSVTMTRVQ